MTGPQTLGIYGRRNLSAEDFQKSYQEFYPRSGPIFRGQNQRVEANGIDYDHHIFDPDFTVIPIYFVSRAEARPKQP